MSLLKWNLTGAQHKQMHKIRSCHDSYLLGNSATYFGKWISTLWKLILSPLSTQNIQW